VDASVDVAVLGVIEVGRDGQRAAVSGTRMQILVAMLALAAPHPVPSDRLVDEIWGDEVPSNAGNALQQQVSKLRGMLGRDAVVHEGHGYRLAVDPARIDVCRLERLLREGRDLADGGDLTAAAERLEAALALARGEVLPGLADRAFAREASTRIGEIVLTAHERLIDVWLAAGAHVDVVVPLTSLVRAHPLRERFHAQLILALYRCGRQADALRAFQDARQVLVEELGIDPGSELQALERAVLAQDPALDAPVAAAAATLSQPAARGPRAAASRSPGLAALPALVGREAERGVLGACLDELVAGRGGVTLIGGEPGIGKTRLAEELAMEAIERGVAVAWGRCYAGRGAPAFWPWAQIVEELLAQFSDDELRVAMGSGAAELSQLVPSVKDLVADLVPPAPTDPESARFRLYEAITSFLRRLSRATPLVVALDDVHWADEASLGLFGFAATGLAHSAVLVVATYRTVDPVVGGPFAATLAEVDRQYHVRRLDVGGLEQSAIAALVATRGQSPDDDAIGTLLERTRGNPFFVTEIVRLLASSGHDLDPDTVSRIIPDSVRGVIRQRVARQPAATIETLAAAAVLGQDVDPLLLADMLDRDPVTILEELEPAVEAGILVTLPGPISRYRFSHGLVNETLYLDLRPAHRSRHHQRAALALEASHGDSGGTHLIPIAAHWFHAIPIAPIDTAIDAALRASRWSAEHVAHAQAIDQLRAALELVAHLPDARQRATRELQVLDQLSGLLIVRDGYGGQGFEQMCARMRELSQQTDDRWLRLTATWRLSVYYSTSVDLDTAIELGEQLLVSGTDNDPSSTLAGHMALSTPLWMRGEPATSRAHLDQALALCRDGHGDELRSVVLESPLVWSTVFSAIDSWLLGDEARADDEARAAIEAGIREGPTSYAAVVALTITSWIAAMARQPELVRARCQDGMARAASGGYQVQAHMLVVNAWATAVLDDVDTGRAEILAASQAMLGAGLPCFQPFHHALLADTSLIASRFDEAMRHADDGLTVVERTGERWWEAELHRLRGEALAGRDVGDPAAVAAFRRAITVAGQQGARALELRATESLARVVR
jgi:DNA-binding SARP family transcriptional activator